MDYSRRSTASTEGSSYRRAFSPIRREATRADAENTAARDADENFKEQVNILRSVDKSVLGGFRNQAFNEHSNGGRNENAYWFKENVYTEWSNKTPTEQVKELHKWSTQHDINPSCKTFAKLVLERIKPA